MNEVFYGGTWRDRLDEVAPWAWDWWVKIRRRPVKTAAAVVAVSCYVAMIVYALAMAVHALADTAAPPTPVISRGGNLSGSDQGSSCMAPPAQRYAPTPGSNPYAWAEPDWPGFFTVTTPVPGTPGCSR